MAVGKAIWPTMHPVRGVTLGTARAGVKYENRTDLLTIEMCEGAAVAGVFTQNAFCAAPVLVGRERLQAGNIRCFVINSGNANACTGKQGIDDVKTVCAALAQLTNIQPEQVIPFSTGVIGEFLPVEKMVSALPQAIASQQADAWESAAQAIMTTDTRPKGASMQVVHQDEVVNITGIAKGAGMIRPNMATMLAFIATDANIAQPLLEQMVKQAADQSFNRISIDGDTSTNDSCMLIATGQASCQAVTEAQGELYTKLADAICQVHQQLALSIVRDGEGATKCVTVSVEQANHAEECLKVAYAIAHSPLVKTALFASDPNWGRIVCAIGYAGVAELDASLVNVYLDDVCIVKDGQRAAGYQEEQGQAVVDQAEFTIRVELGRGSYSDKIWTTDLSHDYVTINAEYRT